MKKQVLIIIFSILSLFAFAQKDLEPKANSFENDIFSEVLRQTTTAKKIEVLTRASVNNEAGSALFFNLAALLASESKFEKAKIYYI